MLVFSLSQCGGRLPLPNRDLCLNPLHTTLEELEFHLKGFDLARFVPNLGNIAGEDVYFM